ncbi:HNH endonuclease (plasmid) [Deinococcus radiomollis]|uniref:HNH endonuclease n=1 Tax=Deinococcus radiomollis TaxID=468916 RepID=UPI0038912193
MSAFFKRGERNGTQYYMLECRTCEGKARRAAYHSGPQVRALQNMYVMETRVKKVFPASWRGSIVKEGAALLLAGKECFYCKTPVTDQWSFCLDHHVPLALGGVHALDNLRMCCEPCNRAKHDMPPEDFKRWMDALIWRLAWLRAQ